MMFEVKNGHGGFENNPIMGKLDVYKNHYRGSFTIPNCVMWYDRPIAAFVIDDFDDIFFMILMDEDDGWEIYRYYLVPDKIYDMFEEFRKETGYKNYFPDGYSFDEYMDSFGLSYIDIKFNW